MHVATDFPETYKECKKLAPDLGSKILYAEGSLELVNTVRKKFGLKPALITSVVHDVFKETEEAIRRHKNDPKNIG